MLGKNGESTLRNPSKPITPPPKKKEAHFLKLVQQHASTLLVFATNTVLPKKYNVQEPMQEVRRVPGPSSHTEKA